jgi:MFS family permease
MPSKRYAADTRLSRPSPDRSSNDTATGIFYGWYIVLTSTIIFIISSGIGFYGHGVFLDPLRILHGWSKGPISLAITLFFLTTGLIGLPLGKKVDRFGSRPILVLGSLITGLALVMLSRITTLWQLYAVYLLMAVGWSCVATLPINTLITNWFIRRRGLAMSITMTGLSIGGILLVPLAAYLISRFGLNTALPLLGALFWVVIVPLALLVIKQRPADIGQAPDGDTLTTGEKTEAAGRYYASQMRTWTRLEAMRTMAFWAIVIGFFMSMTGQVAYLMHQVSFLTNSLGLSGATTAVSVTATASIIGRLLLGTFIDRMEKRYAIVVLFLIHSATMIALAYSSHIIVLYVATFAFGLTMGSILMMQSLIISECFGMNSFATVAGFAGAFIATGAAIGPAIAGYIFDVAQNYRPAFLLFAIFGIIGVIAIFFAKTPAIK